MSDLEWFCLRCDSSGAGPLADREAEKHTKASSHPTTTHMRGMVTLAEAVDEVREQLAAIRKKAE